MATALVTGASSGIGLELARRLARDRYDVVLVARGAERLEAVAAALVRDHGTKVTSLAVNLADPVAPAGIAAEVARRGLDVDVLVNSAGVGQQGPFTETALEKDQTILRLNVEAVVMLTKLLLPGMVTRGRGRVANIASTAAFQPGPFMAVYYASKAFVLSFSEALAYELAGTGVTVTAICPGPTPTGFQAAADLRGRHLQRRRFMPVDRVADLAYRGIMKGKRVVIPGFGNKVLALGARFGPRRWVTNAVGFVNRGGVGSGE